MARPAWIDRHLNGLDSTLLQRIEDSEAELRWLREASADDLLEFARSALGLAEFRSPFSGTGAVKLGNTPHGVLLKQLEPLFEAGTSTAADLADQIHPSGRSPIRAE